MHVSERYFNPQDPRRTLLLTTTACVVVFMFQTFRIIYFYSIYVTFTRLLNLAPHKGHGAISGPLNHTPLCSHIGKNIFIFVSKHEDSGSYN